jgi:hypothetical protein
MVNSTTFVSPLATRQHVRFHIRELEMGGTSIFQAVQLHRYCMKRPLVELKRRSVVTLSGSGRHAV